MENSDIKIFILEDNELYSTFLLFELKKKANFTFEVFQSGEEMLKSVKSGNKPNIIISDYNLEGKVRDALDLVGALAKIDLNIPVVILTAQSDLKTAIQILKEGAFDFIVKDENAFERLHTTLNRVAELIKLKHEIKSERIKSKKDIRRLVFLFAISSTFLAVILLWKW